MYMAEKINEDSSSLLNIWNLERKTTEGEKEKTMQTVYFHVQVDSSMPVTDQGIERGKGSGLVYVFIQEVCHPNITHIDVVLSLIGTLYLVISVRSSSYRMWS